MDSNAVAQITSALQVIYSPQSTNEKRQEAQMFLDAVKKDADSPLYGYKLAVANRDPILKHFGLGLLTNSVVKNWQEYDRPKRLAIREWMVELCVQTTPQDPRYIKEKLAFLWVAVAKRCWGEFLLIKNPSQEEYLDGWAQMDAQLWQLWEHVTSRELVLIIFRTLFEDVFLVEDLVVLKRSPVLQPLCQLVVTPLAKFQEVYHFDSDVTLCRGTSHGWLAVWRQLLAECLENKEYEVCVRLLETLKTCLNWPLSVVVVEENIMDVLVQALVSGYPRAQTLSLDALHILFTRNYTQPGHFDAVIGKIFANMGLLAQVYESLLFDANDDIDESAYPIIKKFVDMVTCLNAYIFKVQGESVEQYLRLVLRTTANQSLIVSGLTLDLWCSLLRNDDFLPVLEKVCLRELLEIAADRLVYYEEIPDHVSKKFAEIDFQSMSDFQTFCSSYRKRIRDILRLVSCVQIDYAFDWLNSRLNSFFSSSYGEVVMNNSFLDKKGEPYLLCLSQLMIVECFVNGCIRWKIWYAEEDYDEKLSKILGKIEVLTHQLIALDIRDPLLLKKQIQNFVLFLTMLKDNVVFAVLEKIITSSTMEYPEEASMADEDERKESIKDLRYTCGMELNRMALLMPESLRNIYPQLEQVVASILPKVSYHETISFKSLLMTVVLKSGMPDKEAKFAEMVDPELAAWSDKDTVTGLTDLPWFMERLGVVQIAEYFQKRGITKDSDLLSIKMDEEGRKLKSELNNRWQALFPVRATRVFVHYSMQNVRSQDMAFLQSLWKPRIQSILPYILRLLYQLQSYHNPANWSELPDIVQSFVKYSTIERFWEAGASSKSKDVFIEEHLQATTTLRDFADSVGHIVRYTREYVLLILSALSSLGEVLYDIEEFPRMLVDSIAISTPNGVSPGVSTHAWKHITNVGVRPLLKNVPRSSMPRFLHEFMPALFETLDGLLCQKWRPYLNASLDGSATNDDEITEEILEENLLRQFTSVVVRLTIDCVGQVTKSSQASKMKLSEHQIAMRSVIFHDKAILWPFLRLLNHLMVFRDSKCSYNTVLVMKCVIPDVLTKIPEVDQFFATEVLSNLVMILTRSEFKDSFGESLFVFSLLFLTLSKQRSATEVLGPFANGFDVETMFRAMEQCTNYKDQKALVLEFIEWIKEEEETENDAKQQQKREALLERANNKLLRKRNETVDILEEDNGLGSLFEM